MSDENEPDVPLESFEVRDRTEPLSVETFNPIDYATGHRATRTAVLIPEKSSLLADITKVEWRIDHAPDDEDVDDLIDEYERLIGEYKAAQRWWTIEARSPEWLNRFRLDFAKRAGLKLGKNNLATNEKDAVALVSGQLVEQVVEVEPVEGGEVTRPTFEQLVELYDDNAVLWNLLSLTMNQVNTQVPQVEAALTRDFSRRSSTARSGTAS